MEGILVQTKLNIDVHAEIGKITNKKQLDLES